MPVAAGRGTALLAMLRAGSRRPPATVALAVAPRVPRFVNCVTLPLLVTIPLALLGSNQIAGVVVVAWYWRTPPVMRVAPV